MLDQESSVNYYCATGHINTLSSTSYIIDYTSEKMHALAGGKSPYPQPTLGKWAGMECKMVYTHSERPNRNLRCLCWVVYSVHIAGT